MTWSRSSSSRRGGDAATSNSLTATRCAGCTGWRGGASSTGGAPPFDTDGRWHGSLRRRPRRTTPTRSPPASTTSGTSSGSDRRWPGYGPPTGTSRAGGGAVVANVEEYDLGLEGVVAVDLVDGLVRRRVKAELGAAAQARI